MAFVPLQIVEIGERMRFHVRSEANPRNTYLVDLLENGGCGECTCPWFRTTIGPAIREGRLTLKGTFPTHPDKHIQAAREHVMQQVFTHMAAKEEPDSTVPHRQAGKPPGRR